MNIHIPSAQLISVGRIKHIRRQLPVQFQSQPDQNLRAQPFQQTAEKKNQDQDRCQRGQGDEASAAEHPIIGVEHVQNRCDCSHFNHKSQNETGPQHSGLREKHLTHRAFKKWGHSSKLMLSPSVARRSLTPGQGQ